MKRLLCLLPCLVCGTLSVSMRAAATTTVVLRVDAVNGSPGGDGSDWGSDAFEDLQDALDQARSLLGGGSPPSLVQIWVAAGTYKPSVEEMPPEHRSKTFLIDFNGVALYGGFAGDEVVLSARDPIANETILSGDIDNDGILDNDNAFHVVKLDGVNSSVAVNGFTIQGGYALEDEGNNFGGGLRILESTPLLARLDVRDNYAGAGGGISIEAGETMTAPLYVFNCEIVDNAAQEFSAAVDIAGGTKPVFVNCLIARNSATNQDGGAARISTSQEVQFVNCTIARNAAASVGGLSAGAGLRVVNSIVWGNIDSDGSTNTLAEQITATAPSVQYSCIQDSDPNDSSIPFGGALNHNIDDVPSFVDAFNGDFRLASGSPCIDVGSNSALPADLADLDADGNRTERTCCDLDMAARVQNGGIALKVDMGAYEFAP